MKRIALAAALLLSACTEPADIRPSLLFTDGVVLQRGHEIPVWGTAPAGTEVEVSLAGDESRGIADASGRWSVKLPAREAGGPYELEIEGPGYSKVVRDVLVGDVWVASGQSNMEWPVAGSRDAEAEIAAANDRMIRQWYVPHTWAAAPVDTVTGGPWTYAVPEQVGDFSAVAYFFARELRAATEVPIGILHTSWGGSRIEPWMSMEALGFTQADMDSIVAADEARAEAVLGAIRARLGEIPTVDQGLVDSVAVWAAPDLDEAPWAPIVVPAMWESQGFDGVDGIAWYRVAFDLTADQAAAGVTLGLGQIDDSDRTWVNGIEVGGMQMAWNEPRVYPVSASALREGRNVVAIRVEDTGGGGGIGGSPDQVYLEVGGARRGLDGWLFRLGEVRVSSGAAKNQVPVGLYNAMIHPFLPFPIKGAIWYQGESNTGGTDAVRYRDLFPAMIADWRTRWGVGDFPFLWAQLANFMAPDPEPAESGWAVLRESQTATLSVANTGQAILIDIGEAEDIHPRNKQDVGKRLALAARHLAYGENLVYSGPTYKAHTIQGGSIIVEFDHVGQGLVGRRTDGSAGAGIPIEGFAIAGANRRFVWAAASIVDGKVVVSSPRVPSPVAVRYAWGNNPDRANLYNGDGLPAGPFRTDSW